MHKPIRITDGVLLNLLPLGVGFSAGYWRQLQRLRANITLFAREKIVANFSHLDAHFENCKFKRSGAVYHFGPTPRPLRNPMLETFAFFRAVADSF